MDSSDNRWKPAIRFAAKTDIGLRRANNQDSHAVVLAKNPRQWQERGHLFVIADGMGAHAAGEVASRVATDTITMSYSKRANEPPHKALVEAVYDAHRSIKEQSDLDDAFRDMGTTVDALVILPQGAIVAHVGDSRIYRLRNQQLEQLTADHSLVWEVCRAGNLPIDKAPSFIPRNQITRSLGPTENLQVDLEGPFPLMSGDVFLGCSDGLSGQVTDTEIGQVLSVLEPDDAVEALVNLANLRGGPDNITVFVAKVLRTDDEPLAGPPFPGFAWVFLCVTILGLLMLAFSLVFSYWIPAAMFGLITLVFGSLLIIYAWKPLMGTSVYDEMEAFGAGPYIRASAVPDRKFVEQLQLILRQFRLAMQGNRWTIRWEKADEFERAADKDLEQKQPSGAVRNLCLAMNYLMRELKNQTTKSKP